MRAPALVAALCCLTLVSACASTPLVPVTNAGFTALESDEAGLWKRAAEQEKVIAESGFVYDDRELEDYVNVVARKIQPETVYKVIPFKIRILKDPHLNAFALADGAVYLHTGILASMANEAQLATLLGHEMIHPINRHVVNKFRSTKSTIAAFSVFVLATGGVGALFAPAATATMTGYSRDVEREADREGFALMERAGYDVAESVVLFQEMKREIEEEKIKEPYFFGTHPRVVERIESYRELIAARKEQQTGVKNTEAFQARVKKLVLDNARFNMQIGRYERAAGGLKRYIDRYPGEAGSYYLLGEANRQQGDAGHEKTAAENYQKALSLDPAHAGSHKMLGIMQYKAGDKVSAQEHLERYLVLDNKASDRTYIEGYIRDCSNHN